MVTTRLLEVSAHNVFFLLLLPDLHILVIILLHNLFLIPILESPLPIWGLPILTVFLLKCFNYILMISHVLLQVHLADELLWTDFTLIHLLVFITFDVLLHVNFADEILLTFVTFIRTHDLLTLGFVLFYISRALKDFLTLCAVN